MHVDGLPRSRIQDAPNAVLLRKRNGVVDSLQGDFELQHDAIGTLQRVGGGIHISGLDRIIRPLDDENTILSAGIDKDGCDPTRQSLHLLYMRSIDPLPLKIFDRRWSEQIAANACHHEYIGPTQPCGYGLIRPLAPES